MPRRRKAQIEAERWEHAGKVEYWVHFPASGQHVIITAKGMNHYKVKDLLYTLAKVPRNLIALDGREENGWRFHVHRYGFDKALPEDPNFELYGYGPNGEELIIGFQRAETGIKALALAVALSKKAEPAPDLKGVLEKMNKKYEREWKRNAKKYAEFIGGGAPKGVSG